MKKKLLIFLGLFIFMIIPKNVYAKEVIPYVSSINNTTYSNDFTSTGSFVNTTIIGNSYLDFTISVKTMELTNVGYDVEYPTFTDFPYIWLFFEMYNSQDQIVISRQSSCNTSCFNGNNMVLKQIGTNPSNNRKRYVLILPVLKASLDWGTQYTFHQVDDILRFENLSSSDRRFTITNILMSDSANIESVADFSSIINNANSNTTTIVNNVNAVKSSIDNMNTAITNSINSTTSAIEDMNNALTSESGVSNSDVSSKTTEWTNKLAGTGPVSQMVLMPITLLNGYVNGMNSTCQPYNLGSLMGTDIILPCINISNYVGVSLWGVIDILFCGFMIFAIGKKFVKIFNDFTNLRDNQMDELYGGGK